MTILTDTKVRAKDRRDWTEPTLYLQRFSEAMTLLCNGNQPSEELLQAWLDDESEALQDFAATYGPSWAQGIGLIDAARLMADQPTEGPDHEHYEESDTAIVWPEPIGACTRYMDSTTAEWSMCSVNHARALVGGAYEVDYVYSGADIEAMLEAK